MMNRFLAPVLAGFMALFLAGQAMAQVTVEKSVTADSSFTGSAERDLNVEKDIDASIEAETEGDGSFNVQGDWVYKELDVDVLDNEAVTKFFELDDSASSSWTITGTGIMYAAEQLQNGEGNIADISQNPLGLSGNEMSVALQYQVGNFNAADILQNSPRPNGNGGTSNNFAKQIQVGELNNAFTIQSGE